MLPIFPLGPLTLKTPGLALLAGIWFALEVAQRVGAAHSLSRDRIYSIGLIVLITSLVGARLSFVLLNLPLYLSISPWTEALRSTFSLAPGTENAWMGVVMAVIAAAILIRHWQMPPLLVLDAFAPAAAAAAVFIGLANLLSGDLYGMPTSLPWGIMLWGMKRHPTQLLMMIAGLLTLFSLFRSGGLKGIAAPAVIPAAPSGYYAQITLVMLSLMLLLIEPLRADSPIIVGGIRVWQVVGLLGLIAALVMFMLRAPSAHEA